MKPRIPRPTCDKCAQVYRQAVTHDTTVAGYARKWDIVRPTLYARFSGTRHINPEAWSAAALHLILSGSSSSIPPVCRDCGATRIPPPL